MEALRSNVAQKLPVTLASLRAAADLAQLILRNGDGEQAESIFLSVERMAMDLFGADEDPIVQILIRIGVLFQERHPWVYGEEWFEKALEASVRSSGSRMSQTRHLQAALERGFYEPEEEDISQGDDLLFVEKSFCERGICSDRPVRHLNIWWS